MLNLLLAFRNEHMAIQFTDRLVLLHNKIDCFTCIDTAKSPLPHWCENVNPDGRLENTFL